MPGKVTKFWIPACLFSFTDGVFLQIVSREEWLIARKDLLVKEKAALRANEALRSQLRTDFPMVELDKEYIFEGHDGQVTLPELFQGRKQ
jgi:predicted dithiol-disulfide oxidoreductase (DUF899 family)